MIEASFAGKDAKRGCDYRQSVIDVQKYVTKTASTSGLKLLFETLTEIQEIVYSHDKDRSSKTILRLYNLTFIHGMEAKRIFKKPKSLTSRKLFGQYFHALTCHAPQQFRIMSLSSTNAENEERSFHFFKDS